MHTESSSSSGDCARFTHGIFLTPINIHGKKQVAITDCIFLGGVTIEDCGEVQFAKNTLQGCEFITTGVEKLVVSNNHMLPADDPILGSADRN
jgi:hypothetical protein